MNRRELLALSSAGITAGIGGCLDSVVRSGASDPNENEPEDGEQTEGDAGLRFVGVYADDVEREFIDGEYILLENDSEDSTDVSGYVVEYPADRTSRVADLVLEPGAQFALSSRRGSGTTLQSSPPIYLRYAGFDTAVLDESGTVRVRNTHGSSIAAASYENGGCDRGTVTDESGSEIECLH